ncbi:MAG: DUF1566 domain-containing protein [bacterium]
MEIRYPLNTTMFKLGSKKSVRMLLAVFGLTAVALAIFLIFKAIMANPDSVSDTFTDETQIASGTDRVVVATSSGKVTLAECYSPDPSWTKIADTIVRDISNLSNSDATTSKDIYCDDYNCVFWTDGAAAPTTVCIATDSDVYGNLLWSKTDAGSPSAYNWRDTNTVISGGDIGGTHNASLQAGDENESIGAKNWLARYYTSTAGEFNAMDICKAKGSGWRLPNLLELDGIRDQAKGSSPYSRLPNLLATSYWSSTESSASVAYYPYFTNGQVSTNSKTSTNYVRCVRGY